MKRLFFFSTALFFCLSYVHPVTAADEIRREYYPDGSIKSEQPLKDGKPEGAAKAYYENGMLQSVVTFKNGREQGPMKVFSDNGTLIVEAFSDNGTVKTFYPSGKLESIQEHRLGKKERVSRRYYESGRLCSQCIYRKNEREGVCTDYFENGRLREKTLYRHGAIEGAYVRFHQSGVLAETAVYDNGTREGITRTYYESGKPREQTNYLNGLKEGIALKFSDEGRLRFIDTYRHNQIIHRRAVDAKENIAFEQEYPYRVWSCNQYCKIEGIKGVYNQKKDTLEAIDTYDNGTIISRMVYDACGKYRETLKGPIIESSQQTPE
jgi:antitoxin component YwqK of YwqJK toxin-antitoxin module